jgi:hypothetical protein
MPTSYSGSDLLPRSAITRLKGPSRTPILALTFLRALNKPTTSIPRTNRTSAYASSIKDGSRIRIRFEDDDGLLAKGGELKGFAIAGPGKDFKWASAKIDGNSVLVWNDAVPNPSFVRYAWANNPECNLCNAAGLPAVPFRTDR